MVVPVVAAPVEKPVAEVKPAAPVVAAPVVKPIAAPPAPVAPGVPTVQAELSLLEQVKRAEAEDEMKLGADAMGRNEYAKARIHYQKAVSLWPDNAKAQKGLKEAELYTGERQEPLSDILRVQTALERQHIIAQVEELLAEADLAKGKADRPEDYKDATNLLDQADRVVTVAKVLTVEEQERLREEILALRHQITDLQMKKQAENDVIAQREVAMQEAKRRAADEKERADKLRNSGRRHRTQEVRPDRRGDPGGREDHRR